MSCYYSSSKINELKSDFSRFAQDMRKKMAETDLPAKLQALVQPGLTGYHVTDKEAVTYVKTSETYPVRLYELDFELQTATVMVVQGKRLLGVESKKLSEMPPKMVQTAQQLLQGHQHAHKTGTTRTVIRNTKG
jgi:hypothetical protein